MTFSRPSSSSVAEYSPVLLLESPLGFSTIGALASYLNGKEVSRKQVREGAMAVSPGVPAHPPFDSPWRAPAVGVLPSLLGSE